MLARMSMSIEKFRASAARRRSSKGRGARYPEAARTWAVQYAEGQLRRGGRSVAAVARDLGISDMADRYFKHNADQLAARDRNCRPLWRGLTF